MTRYGFYSLRMTALSLLLVGGLFTGCDGSSTSDTAEGVLDATDVVTIPQAALTVILQDTDSSLGSASHDAKLTKITYDTQLPDGTPTTATGMLAIPSDVDGPIPVVFYNHGTAEKRDDVPSNEKDDESLLVEATFVGAGYIVIAQDYIGMGDGPGQHPYLNATAAAKAGADMLHAAKIVSDQKGVVWGKLFLAGYSEGGHATFALQHELETNEAQTFPVTAAGPGAGPYDLSNLSYPSLLANKSSQASLIASYFIVTENPYFHLYNAPSDVFQSPFDAVVPTLFDGTHDEGDIESQLPSDPLALLQPAYVQDEQDNPQNPGRLALQANDVVNLPLHAPIRLFHSPTDDLVPFQNSVEAQQALSTQNGDVQVVPIPGGGGHVDSFPGYVGLAREYFDTLK